MTVAFDPKARYRAFYSADRHIEVLSMLSSIDAGARAASVGDGSASCIIVRSDGIFSELEAFVGELERVEDRWRPSVFRQIFDVIKVEAPYDITPIWFGDPGMRSGWLHYDDPDHPGTVIRLGTTDLYIKVDPLRRLQGVHFANVVADPDGEEAERWIATQLGTG
jgi:hypothetical protein